MVVFCMGQDGAHSTGDLLKVAFGETFLQRDDVGGGTGGEDFGGSGGEARFVARGDIGEAPDVEREDG